MADADGYRTYIMVLDCAAEPIGGTVTTSNETEVMGYFSWDGISGMGVVEQHMKERRAMYFRPPPRLGDGAG